MAGITNIHKTKEKLLPRTHSPWPFVGSIRLTINIIRTSTRLHTRKTRHSAWLHTTARHNPLSWSIKSLQRRPRNLPLHSGSVLAINNMMRLIPLATLPSLQSPFRSSTFISESRILSFAYNSWNISSILLRNER